MTMATKKDIFTEHGKRYWSGSREAKQEILSHICFVTGIHRKSAIRKFASIRKNRALRHRGRSVTYSPLVTSALRTLWNLASEPCAELLTPMIPEYVSHLQKIKEWIHTPDTTALLLVMSEATVRRRLAHFIHARDKRRGISATSPSQLKTIIPIFTGPWEGKPPGYGQIDTVVHCGSTLVGDMVFSFNYTDVATMWTQASSQWNKGQYATQESMARVREQLPFPTLGVHPDTGSEFINRFVYDWCLKENIEMTRSRPNHKNDNNYIEERNGHIIRKFVGYDRLDCRETVPVLNDLYQTLGVYLNHFVAVRKCIEKVRIGSRYKRVYDKAKTPYLRVMEHKLVSDQNKQKLQEVHNQLDMTRLKQKVDEITRRLYDIQRHYGTTLR